MPLHECPGPNRKKPATPDIVECRKCGEEFEVWSDDKKAACPKCSTEFAREGEGGRR